ncbi:keratin, type II cytoskeletal 8-like [Myotis daubentonii]|uniref:keratin, type II cytoskeletal 8-like n=1 Tax=Myotis daubentonii TaxID=98922 RepID=UPI002873791F|nr:keratin, type II cytoskeletal 8-like [Myotis daubentonii]
MTVKLALDVEIAIYCKPLEGEENRLESGMQNISIHTNTTLGYLDGLMNPFYGNLNYGLGFQANLGSGGSSCSFNCTNSSKTVVAKKIETQD